MKCKRCNEEIYTPKDLSAAGIGGLRHVKTGSKYCYQECGLTVLDPLTGQAAIS